jgi:signal transduction histidine kinase
MNPSFTTRLTCALAVLLLAYGLMVAVLGRQVATQQEQESLQRLSHGLARHIVAGWPQLAQAAPAVALVRTEASAAPVPAGPVAQAERAALLRMLMLVNPGVNVYLLDADGRVAHYIGEPGMVQQAQVDLAPVRSFLQGAALPLRGTDPMHAPGAAAQHVFSAAMFAPRAGDPRPPGYLYVVLDGAARKTVAAQASVWHARWGLAAGALLALLATWLLGTFTFRRMTLPLRKVAQRMHAYSRGSASNNAPDNVPDMAPSMAPDTAPAEPHLRGNEVQAIEVAFAALTQRIEAQALREHQQATAHRETMAGVAHDLRTPLTALHGQLEALSSGTVHAPRVLQAALAQSDRVRRLSQQLFELATLQSGVQVLHRERLRLDELVTDAVQKFESGVRPCPVLLAGVPPGRLELDGDMQLIERAICNLIDNALRHAPAPPGEAAVWVSVQRSGPQVHVVVEDAGPGLPAELQQRLRQGQSLREPPLRRTRGGIGGLGLAIAQRVAQLHGGSLTPLPAPGGGTRLCLALPVLP